MNKNLTQIPTNLIDNKENEGGTLAASKSETAEPEDLSLLVKRHDARIRRLIERSIRAAPKTIPIKTARDLAAVSALYRLACGEGRDGGKTRQQPLINVQLLSSAGEKPRVIEAKTEIINDSGSEN